MNHVTYVRVGVVLLCGMWLALWNMGCPSKPGPEGGAQDGGEVTAPDRRVSPDGQSGDAAPPEPTTDGGQEPSPPEARPEQPPEANPDQVPNAKALLLIEGGNNQRGEVGKELLRPITVRYIDPLERGVQGASVVFRVVQGGGLLNGKSEVTLQTDKDGRASVNWQLGSQQGFQGQILQVQKQGDATLPLGFVASAFVAGPPEQTRFFGVVIDNKAQPLAGVSVYLTRNNQKSTAVKTDKDGRYALTGLKDFVGQAHLVIDGTTEPSKDLYPKLEYEVFNIAGVDNRLDGPASLPKLDPQATVQVDAAKTAEIKPASVPELRMVIAAGSAIFSDKKKSGSVNVTRVDPYWIPMPLPNGYASSTVVTIQPSDVRFDPPAPITFPNTDKVPAGKLVPILSFDHAKGRYVKVATGRVSQDGKNITSLPGQGIVRGGWHATAQLATVSTFVTNVLGLLGGSVSSGEALVRSVRNRFFRKPPKQSTGKTTTAADPISLYSGAFVTTTTDLYAPARGLSFRFVRSYHSRGFFHSPLGHNWDHNYNKRLLIEGNKDVRYVDGGGRVETFTWDASGQRFTAPAHLFAQLTRLQNGNYVLKWPKGMLYTFDAQGSLRKIEDRFGNALQLRYNLKGQLAQVLDPVGRAFDFHYDPKGHLHKLIDYAGRVVLYQYDKNDDLVSVTTPSTRRYPKGKTTTYTYSTGDPDIQLNHNLLTITDAKKQTYLTNKYNKNDQVIEQIHGPGTYKLTYQEQNPNGDPKDLALVRGITTVTDPEGNVVKHHFNVLGNAIKTERLSRKLRPTDPASWVTTSKYNANGRLTEITYPNGNRVAYTYDSANADRLAQGNVLSIEWFSHRSQDAHKSLKRSFTYEGRYQLLKTAVDPRGTCSGCDAKRYTRTLFYDYEEKQAGDLNGDGKTDGDKGFLVKVQMPQATLPDGKKQSRELKYQPNGFGQVAQFIDAMGVVTQYEYYPAASPNTPFDGEGYLKRVLYDAQKLKLSSSYGYDALGNVTSYTNPRGQTWRYHYNPRRQLLAKIAPAPFQYKSFYQYDANDKLEMVLRENKDHANKAIAEHPYLQRKWVRGSLDEVLEIHREVSPGQWLITKLERDKLRRTTKITYPEGNAACFAYDERSQLLSRTRGCGGAQALKLAYGYDANGNLTSVTYPGAQKFQRVYDGYNRLLRSLDPVGSSREYTYDRAGHRVSVARKGTEQGKKDTLLAQTDVDVDEWGRRIRIVRHLFDAPGSTVSKLQLQRFYDPSHRLIRQVDARGNSWSFRYDSAHRLIERLDPEGNGVQFTLDAGGLVTQKTILSKSSLAGVSDGSYAVEYTYDALGRLRSRKNRLGHLLSFGYNSRNQLMHVTDGEGNVRSRSFDGVGRITSLTRELRVAGKVTGKLVSRWAWDKNSRLQSITDAKGQVTRYTYDALDRPTGLLYPAVGGSQAQLKWSYDANGRLATFTDANGSVRTYSYDDAHRLTRLAIQRATGILGVTSLDFKYDGLHRLLEVKNDHSTATMVYDSLHRLRSETLNGKTSQSTYDPSGNRLSLQHPGGTLCTMSYDKAHRLRQVAQQGISTPLVAYHYVGRTPIGADLSNGVKLRRKLDAIGRVVEHTYRDKNNVLLAGYGLRYNKANHRVYRKALHDSTQTQVFGLDSLYRLTQVAHGVADPDKELATPGSQTAARRVSYTLDGLHSRSQSRDGSSQTRYTSNALNQYTAIGASSRVYDKNGNLIDDGTQLYAYDFANRLIEVRKKQGNTLVATYKYGPLGRRIEKKVGSAVTRYTYSGLRLLEERDGQDKIQAIYTHGRRIDERLTLTRGSTTYYYLHNMQRSVVSLTGSQGQVIERYRYDAFGRFSIHDPQGQSRSSSIAGNPYTFTGRRWDSESQLFHFRMRSYQPLTGRFLQRDPKGFVDGLNLYTYAQANPVSYRDPLGLEKTQSPEPSSSQSEGDPPDFRTEEEQRADDMDHYVPNAANSGRYYTDGEREWTDAQTRELPHLKRLNSQLLDSTGEHDKAQRAQLLSILQTSPRVDSSATKAMLHAAGGVSSFTDGLGSMEGSGGDLVISDRFHSQQRSNRPAKPPTLSAMLASSPAKPYRNDSGHNGYQSQYGYEWKTRIHYSGAQVFHSATSLSPGAELLYHQVLQGIAAPKGDLLSDHQGDDLKQAQEIGDGEEIL